MHRSSTACGGKYVEAFLKPASGLVPSVKMANI